MLKEFRESREHLCWSGRIRNSLMGEHLSRVLRMDKMWLCRNGKKGRDAKCGATWQHFSDHSVICPALGSGPNLVGGRSIVQTAPGPRQAWRHSSNVEGEQWNIREEKRGNFLVEGCELASHPPYLLPNISLFNSLWSKQLNTSCQLLFLNDKSFSMYL